MNNKAMNRGEILLGTGLILSNLDASGPYKPDLIPNRKWRRG